MSAHSGPGRVVRVGIIGCGEVSQVIHIPTLSHLSDLYRITYLCDVSDNALEHSRGKIIGSNPVKTTRDPVELCSSPDVDVVLVVNSDEYHVEHTVLGLEHNKTVFVEKPMALNERDVDRIIEAEKKSEGTVMVGYMRRYAAGFIDALKETGGLDKIFYARVRDIIGPNSIFVSQSGTFPKRFTDLRPEDTKEKDAKAADMLEQGLTKDNGIPVNNDTNRMWRLLGGLGSHDLSVMREALGMPTSVLGASLGYPFWNVLFQYPGFCVSYESGIDNVPRFDAHLEIYSMTKSVRVQYDTPYVKGLPVTMHIRENDNGAYKETVVRRTYEDPYTLEMKELYELVVNRKPVKTTAQDAANDLKIFQMIMKAGAHSIYNGVEDGH